MNRKVFIIAGGIIGVGIIVLIISLVVTSMGRLESYEVGLKYNTYERKLQKDVFYEGLHFGAPGFEFIKFAAVFKSFQINKFRVIIEQF